MENHINKIILFEESSNSSISLFNTSSSSSSSSSSSESDRKVKKNRMENYMEVIDKFTDAEFKEHFRVVRSAAEKLIRCYREYRSREKHGGRKEAGAKCEILLTIWYLSNTETYRQISDRFNLSQSSVHRILNRVTKWILTESYNYIKWPKSTEMIDNQVKFKRIKQFPRVVGAIDGTHIRINPPKNNKKEYYNRKKYFSILLQGIVDSDKKFIDIHCGEPGSMHDARLFRKSNFYKKISENQNLIIPGGILLGDTAYPENYYLIPPYKDFGNLSSKHQKFNYLHSATRIVVENAFGLLKSRFRRLKFFESRNIRFVVNCVVAACVLHNICIEENAQIDQDDIDIDFENLHDETFDLNESDLHIEVEGGLRDDIFKELDTQGLLN